MQPSLTIGVNDLATTMSFYRRIPGFEPHWISGCDEEHSALLLAANGLTIVFQTLHEMERQHPALLQYLTRTRLGAGIQLEFTCPDLEPLYCTARRLHWPILYELEDRQHRRRELWLQDPDGYLLVFNEESQHSRQRPARRDRRHDRQTTG